MAVCGDKEGMLAGVCSWLANRLGWNVWAIRAVLLILLVAEPLGTAIAYALAAVVLNLVCRYSTTAAGNSAQLTDLQSPDLSERKQRISELEQRFRKWEDSLDKE